jgi:MFS transporter, DHA1 family, solute carrier family 18 (vesicular amine transporter), member 1/2
MGYFIGTNFFGSLSYRVGQIKMSVLAIMVVGISCVIIPEAKTVSSLIIPHFCLGLGIGILDTSLVPFLARLTDSIVMQNADENAAEGNAADEVPSSYGSIYAIQQTSVSLAYSIGTKIISGFQSKLKHFTFSSISCWRNGRIDGFSNNNANFGILQFYLRSNLVVHYY